MQLHQGGGAETAIVRSMVGKTITQIERVLFVYKGKVNEDHGPLQISLGNGEVILLRGGGDGQTLHIDRGGWQDPFEPPLDSENERFVAESGKWSLFDVSYASDFAPFVGHVIQQVFLVRDVDNLLRGVELIANGRELIYVVEWDEGLIIGSNDRLADIGLFTEL